MKKLYFIKSYFKNFYLSLSPPKQTVKNLLATKGNVVALCIGDSWIKCQKTSTQRWHQRQAHSPFSNDIEWSGDLKDWVSESH